MKEKRTRILVAAAILFFLAAIVFAAGQQEGAAEKPKSIAVYMPGLLGAGNAMLEMAKAGAEKAEAETGVNLKLIEGGYDWSTYEPSLKQLSATGEYDAIMCFTAGFPGIIQTVAAEFPNQKYMLVDAVVDCGDQAYSVQFNSAEMAFLAGVFAACVTTSDMAKANPEKKIGMTAGMIYPEMTDLLKPGYENGAHWIDPGVENVFTVTDSWTDPLIGKEIGINMYKVDVDIIFMISSTTDLGTIEAGEQQGYYCISVNTNMNSTSPGVVLTGVTKAYDQVVYQTIKAAAEGTLKYGAQDTFGIKDGLVGYTPDDPLYLKYVPKDIQDKMKEAYEGLKKGKIDPLNP
ncbi:MAG: BMP family ABC transporter substrate-binding protein [Proteobacteria bacterium]|nr:BMP family ABC transporter substrate-binding protein [Pseudomonadota bacterium]